MTKMNEETLHAGNYFFRINMIAIIHCNTEYFGALHLILIFNPFFTKILVLSTI